MKAHSAKIISANQSLTMELKQFAESNEQAILKQDAMHAKYQNLKEKLHQKSQILNA